MAHGKGPLLSLQASGEIAKSLQYSHRGHDNIIRSKPFGIQTQTPKLLAAQSHHRNAVYAYRKYLTNAVIRDSWNRYHTYTRSRRSGYDEAMKSMLSSYAQSATPAIVSFATPLAGSQIGFEMIDLVTGSVSAEASNFQILYGDKPDSLFNSIPTTITHGALIVTIPGSTRTIYARLTAGSTPRSGIIPFNLIAGDATELTFWGGQNALCEGDYKPYGSYGGKNSYRAVTGAGYFIWYRTSQLRWYCSPTRGDIVPAGWYTGITQGNYPGFSGWSPYGTFVTWPTLRWTFPPPNQTPLYMVQGSPNAAVTGNYSYNPPRASKTTYVLNGTPPAYLYYWNDLSRWIIGSSYIGALTRYWWAPSTGGVLPVTGNYAPQGTATGTLRLIKLA